ncbi:MAG: excinuclease ABC subunit UvrA [bacterium]|nr:MAG: excinuclease ABC subunit UvrA [bacterium]
MKHIVIRGARQHNLKNVDLRLPRREIIVVTGVSGSGKSSLAFDTIYAEGQRRYIESLSTYARQFIEKLERPDVDEISGISPTIAIRQKNTVTSARSTVGTATEIYDYLRLLFARAGRTICPDCRLVVRSYTPSDVAQEVIRLYEGRRVFILLPVSDVEYGDWESKRSYLLSRGYIRLLVGDRPQRIDEYRPGRKSPRELAVLLDRIEVDEARRIRIAEAVEIAYRERTGVVEVIDAAGRERHRFTHAPTCTKCGRSFDMPTPLLFSFNSPYGACPDCRGFGDRMEFSEDLIVPDASRSLEDRAIDPWSRERFSYFHEWMLDVCRQQGIPTDKPYRSLSGKYRNLILEGGEDYIGVIPFLDKMREKSYKKGHRFFTRKYMEFTTCRMCQGGRLRPEALYVTIAGKTIVELNRMVPAEIIEVLSAADFDEREQQISHDIITELTSRLGFMIDVGLGYLTLERLTRTLSGGEAQRINLANSLGANLVDALYVLDEPSIGLHPADNDRLIKVLKRLKSSGNTVLVVEHDPDIILSSDYMVDLGPGAGNRGGEVLYSGSVAHASKKKIRRSETYEWIFRRKRRIEKVRKRAHPTGTIVLKGVSEHNIKDIDVSIPLGCMVCVTGVSGSGKSTLVVDVLYQALLRSGAASHLSLAGMQVKGDLDRVLLVDQSPIGASPRSNPITYIKGFSFIREIFARQRASVARGYLPGRFSFNKPGGRCSRCQGMGYRRVEMHFMADVFVPCEVCGGKRYNAETLEIRYKGRSISEVLDMTVEETLLFFDETPMLGEKLWVLSKVGLGYLQLGQPSNTLSGGEAQRIKIARELAESKGERNLYIMDEPTTGLHMSDVERLLRVLDELVRAGHTVLVIEHNMEVIRWADYLIDLGPGGGEDGGRVIACGPPETIVQCSKSKTGRHLKEYKARYGREA